MGLFKRKLTFVDEAGKEQELPEESLVNKGDLVKDKITGFTGIVICVLDYLHGCKRIAVKSKELKEGKPVEEQYFDEYQLEVIEAGAYFKEPIKAKVTGGEQEIRDTREESKVNLHRNVHRRIH